MLAAARRGIAKLAARSGTVGLITAAAVASSLVLPGVAAAAPPSNDDLGAATAVTALPFTTQADTSEATKASDDPAWCQYHAIGGTVWYSYTPAEDVLLRATTAGSDHRTILSAYTGARGQLDGVPGACGVGAPITFRAQAGTTYHIMVAGEYTPGGALSFGLQEVAPAPNDNFAQAETITGLPATREIDLTVASTEYDEPGPHDSRCPGVVDRSVWYTFTAGETRSLVAKVADAYQLSVSVYTGSTLVELTEVGCASGAFAENVVFRATAGTTYHLRVGGPDDIGAARLTLGEAPPLQPQFGVSPSDPTIYELTSFAGRTGEYGTPIASGEWDFGDGTVVPASDNPVAHHYTADGTYQVRLTVVSPDGRTGTRTSTVTVDTHDVSISRFVTPSRARAGESREIAVRVANTRYRESVTTELYRSSGAGWDLVGTLTLDVPANAGRTVTFPFAYTFTEADAVAGKVSFRAKVSLPYQVRDARPFDNELISTGTTVRPA